MPVTIFLCYAAEDEYMVGQLKKHLSLLKRNRVIELWDYGDISAGFDREKETYKYLDKAQIILLLISSSYFDSDYCYSLETRAIERHVRRKTWAIPVILRPVRWEESSLGKLQPLPDNGKPILKWRLPDEGYENVADGIVKVIEQIQSPGLSRRRTLLIAQLDQLIETVREQMQPPGRARAVAHTLQQLSPFIPDDVTLADLVEGWWILSHASERREEPATAQRRVTCNELANIASQITDDEGNLAQAIKTWSIWADAFKKSDDPRQTAMAKTFSRELKELQEAMR